MKQMLIALVIVSAAMPAFGWNQCGFQIQLDRVTLKKHFAEKNPRNALLIQMWTDQSGDFTASLKHTETIHKDYVDQEIIFYSQPEAGEFLRFAGSECLNGKVMKTLPKKLFVRVTQVNGWDTVVLNEVYDLNGLIEVDRSFTASNEGIELRYRMTRAADTVNHL